MLSQINVEDFSSQWILRGMETMKVCFWKPNSGDDTDTTQTSKNPERFQTPYAHTSTLTFTADSCFFFHKTGIRLLWKSAHPCIWFTGECVIDASWLPRE